MTQHIPLCSMFALSVVIYAYQVLSAKKQSELNIYSAFYFQVEFRTVEN